MLANFRTSHHQFSQRRTVTSSRFVPRAALPGHTLPTPDAPSTADLASEALYKEALSKVEEDRARRLAGLGDDGEGGGDVDDEEEMFDLEELIANPNVGGGSGYSWEDKYRPRKPRYFNRVHTGYEWNKYNQTHYEYVVFSFCLGFWLVLTERLACVARITHLRKLFKDTRYV